MCVYFIHKFVELLCEQVSAQQIQYEYKGKIKFLLVNETEKLLGINEPSQPHSFESLRQNFNVFISSIRCLIADNVSSLENLKSYLQRYYRELKPQLAHAKLAEDVITIIVEKYNIINVDCLEAVVDHLEIVEAKAHISSYNVTVDNFFEGATFSACYNKSFKSDLSSHLLNCETVELTLEWKIDRHKLNDVRVLLSKFFGDIHKRVYIMEIKKESFIIVTCYTPQYMVDVLLIEAEKNSELMEEFEVVGLKIGYVTVYDKLEVNIFLYRLINMHNMFIGPCKDVKHSNF